MENEETLEAAVLQREAREEALAEIDVGSLLTASSTFRTRARCTWVFYRAGLVGRRFGVGLARASTPRCFHGGQGAWDDLAFPSVEFTLQRYFADRAEGRGEGVARRHGRNCPAAGIRAEPRHGDSGGASPGVARLAASVEQRQRHNNDLRRDRSCIRCKYMDCVEVCPVDCFHEGPNFLVIDPEECIDCTLCEPECPVEAIYSEDEVPLGQEQYLQLNKELAKSWPVIRQKKVIRLKTRSVEGRSRQAPVPGAVIGGGLRAGFAGGGGGSAPARSAYCSV